MIIPALPAWIIAALLLVALAVATWRRTTRPSVRAVLAILAAVALSVALSGTMISAGFILLDVVLVAGTWYLARSGRMAGRAGLVWTFVLVLVLVIAKLPQVQPIAGPGVWIGVSYFIFRLIHVSFDARRNRLGDGTFSETLDYGLHPATLYAGPIDRVQHSVEEQRCVPPQPSLYISDGLWRLFVGLFKKAALVPLCYAFINMHDLTRQPDQPTGIAWLWLLAYAFYLYFDFAGYSDIAIGLGRLMGIRLPET